MSMHEFKDGANPEETLAPIGSRVKISFDTTLGTSRFLFEDVDPEVEKRFLGDGGMFFEDPSGRTESFSVRMGFNVTFDNNQTGRLVAVTYYDFFRQKAFMRAMEALKIPSITVETSEPEDLFEEPVEPQPHPLERLFGAKLIDKLLHFDEEELPELMHRTFDDFLESVRWEIEMPQLTPEETRDLQVQRRAMHEELRILHADGTPWVSRLEMRLKKRGKLPPEKA